MKILEARRWSRSVAPFDAAMEHWMSGPCTCNNSHISLMARRAAKTSRYQQCINLEKMEVPASTVLWHLSTPRGVFAASSKLWQATLLQSPGMSCNLSFLSRSPLSQVLRRGLPKSSKHLGSGANRGAELRKANFAPHQCTISATNHPYLLPLGEQLPGV